MFLQPDQEGTISERFIFLEKNTILPKQGSPTEANGSGWTVVPKNIDLRRFEKELFAEGWMFFYTVWTVSTTRLRA